MQYVEIKITPQEFAMASVMAEKSCIGGVSRIHEDRDERLKKQGVDSIVGQLGSLAGHKYLTGSVDGYIRERYCQNKTPREGDGGEDVLGANIDFKASLWRFPEGRYHLCVRPRERHSGWVYIHALVPKFDVAANSVFLTGWASDDMLPDEPDSDGPLSGAFTIPVDELNEMMPIRWRWFQ